MVALDAILHALDLVPTGLDRFCGENVPGEADVVFGGQLLAQSIVAGARRTEGRTVKTIHTVFARSAWPARPVDIVVEPLHAGRTFASGTVTISQDQRVCTRSMLLVDTGDEDLIRHGQGPAHPSRPEDAVAVAGICDDWEVRVVDGVDVADPDAVGPAELDVWTRFVGAPSDPVTSQALLAFATDGFLIGTAMRPHAGVGQAQAHQSLSTGVISHTLTFHEPFEASEWLLLSHRSPYAGRGRTYGTGEVFRGDGQLVASFVQDGMIRPMTARPMGEGRAL